jgi:hypothetical protein
MEGEFNQQSEEAASWSMVSESNHDILALDAYDIGLWSESACWELEPEPGYIEVIDWYFPEVLPLCIFEEDMTDWYFYVHVYGGYTIEETCLWLYQKNYDWQEVIVDVELRPGVCCTDYYYMITFSLPDDVEKLCFDANNFPEVCDPFDIWWADDADLEKEIYAYFCSLWSGCEEPTQEFTISKAHEKWDPS